MHFGAMFAVLRLATMFFIAPPGVGTGLVTLSTVTRRLATLATFTVLLAI